MFNADATKHGAEFLVNTYTTSGQEKSSIAAVGTGFLITWQSYLHDSAHYGVYAKMYDATGNPIAKPVADVAGDADGADAYEFRVNTHTTDGQVDPIIASNTNGFIIVWPSSEQDGSDYGVYAQMYHADGTKNGAEFKVNTYTSNTQTNPSVASLSDGFLITWHSKEQDAADATEDANNYGVFAQQYNNDAVAVGVEFQVNTYEANSQTNPSVATTPAGVVIVWESIDQPADNDGQGIFAQMFTEPQIVEYGFSKIV